MNVNYDKKSNFNKRLYKNEIIEFQQSKINTETQVDRTRRKNKKKYEKITKSQSLINLYNNLLNKYDNSIFIRQILQNNKIDII